MNEALVEVHNSFLKSNIMIANEMGDGHMIEVTRLIALRQFAVGYLNGYEQAMQYIITQMQKELENTTVREDLSKEMGDTAYNWMEYMTELVKNIQAEESECFEHYSFEESSKILIRRSQIDDA